MKAEIDKLNINKLVNVQTRLNNLKTKVDGLDVSKLKTVPVDFFFSFFFLTDEIDNEVVKNAKFNSLSK